MGNAWFGYFFLYIWRDLSFSGWPSTLIQPHSSSILKWNAAMLTDEHLFAQAVCSWPTWQRNTDSWPADLGLLAGNQPVFVSPQNAGKLFRIRVVGGSAAYSYLSPQDSRPLSHPAVDRYKTTRQQNTSTPPPASRLYTFQMLLHSFEFRAKLLQSVFLFRNIKLHLFKGLRKASNKAMLVTKQFKWGVPSVIITVLTSGRKIHHWSVCLCLRWKSWKSVQNQLSISNFIWSLLTRSRSAQIKVKCAWKGTLRGTASLLKSHLHFSSRLCVLVLACIAAVPVLPPSWLQWGWR